MIPNLLLACLGLQAISGWPAAAAPPGGAPEAAPASRSATAKAGGRELAPLHRGHHAAAQKPWSWNGAWMEWKTKRVKITYTRKHGLVAASRGGNYSMAVRARTQLRFSHPFDFEPHRESQLSLVDTRLRFTRVRLTAKGHAVRPWVEYKFQYDLRFGFVRDAEITVRKWRWLQFRAGQWKADYNRARITSSIRDEFADHSLINRTFCLGRQAGFELLGRLLPGSRADSRYFIGLFTGTGRGGGFESGGHPLLMARYQWNFLGRDVPFTSADLDYHEHPAASLAVAAATNRSRYTRFSSAGGGELDGFRPGRPGQYTLQQTMGELALLYRGFSAQSEYHWKEVFDHATGSTTRMNGAYAQAGYLPHAAVARLPRQLGFAYRYSVLNPRMSQGRDLWHEHTVAVNWFFEGYRNRFTFDVSRISFQEATGPSRHTTRYRLQWDILF